MSQTFQLSTNHLHWAELYYSLLFELFDPSMSAPPHIVAPIFARVAWGVPLN